MCNCKADMEGRLLAEVYGNRLGTDHKVELTGYGFMMKDNNIKLRPVMPIEHTFTIMLKNGTTKRKKEIISFALSHCPFCGESVEQEK